MCCHVLRRCTTTTVHHNTTTRYQHDDQDMTTRRQPPRQQHIKMTTQRPRPRPRHTDVTTSTRRHADETTSTQRDLPTKTRTNTSRHHTQPSLKPLPPPPPSTTTPLTHPKGDSQVFRCQNTQQTRHKERHTETVIHIATAGAETRARQHDQLSWRTLDVVWWRVCGGGGGGSDMTLTCATLSWHMHGCNELEVRAPCSDFPKNSTPSTDEAMLPNPRKMLPKNALTAPSKHGTESLRDPRNKSSAREHEPARKQRREETKVQVKTREGARAPQTHKGRISARHSEEAERNMHCW